MNEKEAKIILEDIKNTYKYCCKNNNAKQISINVDYKIAEAIETVLNLIEKQKAEIELYKRVMDLMAEFIGDNIDEEHCEKTIGKGKCEKYGQCLECIKEYFENKVKESK